MDCHSHLQGIFPTPGLLHCRWILYRLSHQGSNSGMIPGRGTKMHMFSVFSRVRLFTTPRTVAHQASLSYTVSQSLLEFMPIDLVMLSNHLILCHPLLLLPSIFSSIRVFSSESALQIRRPKYWSFSIIPSSEYSGMISFRIDLRINLLTAGSLCSPRDSQGSSPAPQFESMNSSMFKLFLYGPTLTSVYVY